MPRTPTLKLLKVYQTKAGTVPATSVMVLQGLPKRRRGCDWQLCTAVTLAEWTQQSGCKTLEDWIDAIRAASDKVMFAKRRQYTNPRHSERLPKLRAELHELRTRLDSWVASLGIKASDGVAFVRGDAERVRFVGPSNG